MQLIQGVSLRDIHYSQLVQFYFILFETTDIETRVLNETLYKHQIPREKTQVHHAHIGSYRPGIRLLTLLASLL